MDTSIIWDYWPITTWLAKMYFSLLKYTTSKHYAVFYDLTYSIQVMYIPPQPSWAYSEGRLKKIVSSPQVNFMNWLFSHSDHFIFYHLLPISPLSNHCNFKNYSDHFNLTISYNHIYIGQVRTEVLKNIAFFPSIP